MGGLIDRFNSEENVDEPSASVGKEVEKGDENCWSSKVLRNMDEME